MKFGSILVLMLAGTSAAFARDVLPDSLDTTPEFRENHRALIEKIRKSIPYASAVPEREWNNFVAPMRVNNEKLDSAGAVFFAELAPRIAGMSMTEAALEVNHWCHEKMNYRPSDARTSSPLASLKTSWGRCGEESTFAVAALRSVGIPARQVYTPRWAHTDDNHAWVEVWTDGRWHFLGACEPEPILDLAWFNEPASRGMLMTTRVRNGEYDGPEEVLDRNEYITTINVTENYAPVQQVGVTVREADGSAANGAEVCFTLYNYGEFYTVARKKADSAGRASLTAGKGDMLVWARNPQTGRFGYSYFNGHSSGAPVEIVLDKNESSVFSDAFTLVPPAQSASLPKPSAQEVALNEVRKAREDSIRMAYMSTFVDLERGRAIASSLGYADTERVATFLRDSYGNHATITDFLKNAGDKDRAIGMLGVISEKDLRDIEADILEEYYATPGENGEFFYRYVMSPRVANENLSLYKKFFGSVFDKDSADLFRSNPVALVDWVKRNIGVSSVHNPENFYISPVSVWNHRRDIDARSRNVFFVSLARSLGIPARIDPVTAKPQWWGGEWNDALFDARKAQAPQGRLCLTYDGKGAYPDPQYYYQFTVSRIDNGKLQLLEFDEEGTSWSNTFSGNDGFALDEGQYMLVSGQRLAKGGVLANMEVFTIREGETTRVPLVLRSDADGEPQVIGSFNSENMWIEPGAEGRSLLSATGRGFYVLGVIRPGHEPSAHALNELRSQADAVGKWGVKVVLLAEDADSFARFRQENFEGLPDNVILGIATPELLADLAPSDSPTFIIADTFNRVVFRSQGYSINLPGTLGVILSRCR